MTQYDDTLLVKESKMAFDLTDIMSVPDLRNLKYACDTDHLTCPICKQPFLQPMSTLCGHTFCKECIEECLKMGSSLDDVSGCGFCPLDRTSISSEDINDLFPTPLIITNMVDELKVYCLNLERGCSWKGHRWEVETHVRSECGYTGVHCNGGRYIHENDLEESEIDQQGTETPQKTERSVCKILVERRFIDLSIDDCVHKIFECNYCGTDITKVTENCHLETECSLYFQICDICQNDMIPKKALEKHIENCRKSGRQICPAHEIGCDWVGSNAPSLENHLESGNCPYQKLQPYLLNLESKISEVDAENKHLQLQIHQILDSIMQGKVTNLGYSEPLEEIGKFTRTLSKIQDQDRLLNLDYEVERLRSELEEKVNPFMERETTKNSEQQTIINGLVSDNFMMKDEMSLQRALINSLRKQVQFLSFRNRQQHFAGASFPSLPMELEDFADNLVPRSNSEERLNLKL